MRFIIRILLGAVFCVSAISKLFSMGSFELYLFSFEVFSFDLCSLAARILVGVELVLGLVLASGLWRKAADILCAVLLGAMSVFLVWRMAAGDTSSCHCFGDVLKMNPGESLVKNLVLAALLVVSWPAEGPLPGLLARHRRGLMLSVIIPVAVAVAAFTAIFCIKPPSFYFRFKGHASNDLVEQLWEPHRDAFGLGKGREAVLFLSPLCEHCAHCAPKVLSIARRHSIDLSSIHFVFMTVTDRPEDMDKLIPYFYEKAGIDDPGVDTHILGYEEFIPMTDGSMPLVCLFEDDALVREFSDSSLDEKFFAGFFQ